VRHLLRQGSHHAPLPWRPRFGPSFGRCWRRMSSIQFVSANTFLILPCIAKTTPEVVRRFLEAPLSAALTEDLKSVSGRSARPLGSYALPDLLENSQYQPFTGVYETFMLGNQQPNPEDRLAALTGDPSRIQLRRSATTRSRT